MALINDFKLIFEILQKEDRFDFFFLVIVLIFTSLLEVVGIASIIPFIHSIINQETLLDNKILKNIYLLFEFSDKSNFQVFIFTCFSILVILSLLLRSLSVYIQYKFALLKEFSISKRLLSSYINQDYLWFTNQNSSKLIKNLLSEVSTVVNVGIVHYINIISQIFIILSIISVLLIVNFKISLISGIFLISIYFFTFKYFGSILKNFGDQRYNANEKRFFIVDEIFNAIRELKFFNLTEKYKFNFNNQNLKYVKTNLYSSVISVLPRYFFEFIIFSFMLIFIFIILKNNLGLINLVPIISFYLFACYRLMPALQSSYNSISKLKFTNKSLHKLHDELLKVNLNNNGKDLKIINNEILNFKNSIEFKAVDFKYPTSKKKNLQNITAQFTKGKKIGITGETGSGKTTFLNLLTGMFPPTNGKILVDNKELKKNNINLFRKKIGYAPQNTILIDDTLAANIALSDKYSKIDYQRLINAAKCAEIFEYIDNDLPEKFETYVGQNGAKLSGGQKQRIGIARALYKNPNIIIFDEATNALDNLTEKNIFKNIFEIEQITLFVISHNIEIFKEFDEILVFKNGKIITQH